MEKKLNEMVELKYLRLLAREYKTIAEVSTEIINLKAILCLPKGTEHFISDIHGEYEAFLHMLKNASGVVREKINILFENSVTLGERNMLATLIYYPEKKLEKLQASGIINEEWYKITLVRLVEVCRLSSSKYTRSKVRKALPKGFEYVIDELLHVTDTMDKQRYNNEIIRAIIETDQADGFIIAISKLIQRLVIDRLHVVGDIFDRGPGAHIILDALSTYHDVDVQWGNHDILWMGAAAGNDALIATTIINSLRYGNVDTIEDGYGISLSPLVTFALEIYADDPCARFYPRTVENELNQRDAEIIAKMHKAMAIILFKLEGALIARNPEFHMEARLLLDKIDFEHATIMVSGVTYPLTDQLFPTVLPSNPYALSEGEQELIDKLRMAYYHSEKLQQHIRFLYASGSIYLRCNGNLLFHGCVPTTADGEFVQLCNQGKKYSGKALFDRADRLVRQGYFSKWDTPERIVGLDFIWYLWCGPNSPLFGKDRMTTFERYFIADTETHTERKNAYFQFAESEAFAQKLLEEFDMNAPDAVIINGHVPVKIRKGESPLKANGRIIVIDGGMSKAYQKETGVAGYTLISSSNGLVLSCHDPFVTVDEAIESEVDIHSTQTMVSRPAVRKLVADTDVGYSLSERIKDLTDLLHAYQNGLLKEAH
ncbi:MAG: fructose-1,6-bisphosphatase [Clostridia bacterium]